MRRPALSFIRSLHSTPSRVLDKQTQDIVTGDLGATLEAHRASNLRARIRKYGGDPRRTRALLSEDQFVKQQEARARKTTAQETHARHSPQLRTPAEVAQEWDEEERSSGRAGHRQSESTSWERVDRSQQAWQKQYLNEALASGSYVPPHTYRGHLNVDLYDRDVLSEPIDAHDK